MSTASLAVEHRPLPFRCRAGLNWRASGAGRIVSDTVTGRHHELSADEAALLEWLTDRPSLRILAQRYNQRFAPRRIETAQLQLLLARLHEAGLIESTARGPTDSLWRRRQEQRSRERRWAWTRLLAFRVPMGRPAWCLEPLRPVADCLFSRLGLLIAIGCWIAGAMAITGAPARFVQELPRLAWLGQPDMAVTLLIALALIKTLHEVAHGLAATRFDVRVREAGVLFLFFTPCLYCDVSDAWRLADRRARMMIGAAGVLAEITLAALAAIVWRFAEPGLLSVLAMNTMVLASLGTLLVNLNPLVRFDGYYLLSDATETANLAERGRRAATRLLTRPFYRADTNEPPESRALACYGLASQAYLAVMLGGFLWLVISVSRTWHLEALGWMLVGVIGASVLAGPLRRLTTLLAAPRKPGRFRTGRLFFGATLAALLIGVFVAVPCPRRIDAKAIVALVEPATICVTHAGRLIETTPLGSHLVRGDVIARLENPATAQLVASARAELKARQEEVRLLESLRESDPLAAAQLPTAKAAIASARGLLDEALADSERLTLRAPRAGIVMASPLNEPSASLTSEARPDLDPSLLSPEHRGRWLELGTPLCVVADPNEVEIELFIDERVATDLAPGQRVRVALDQREGRFAIACITQIASHYDSLLFRGEKDRAGSGPQRQPWEQSSTRVARATLTADQADQASMHWGGLGRARIEAGTEPLASQLLGWLRRNFSVR
ncbi:site-2 protease family protein [Botrimarina hoheduenensis]|uniref:Peptidase family M50 n=1 Tax=Botrimarina hoheduenensis TaxID=2528000 RepID=A0A5C5VY53_9BACT|nr:site-2 protease family protein [Botrimarina hoheduenensis]TWT43354.1 Peptidase family M50 [Botrimarina hoheduenensis]